MKTMEDYAKEVTKRAGIPEFSDEAKTVHEEIYRVMGGGKYQPFNPNDLGKYNGQISNNIIRTNSRLGAQVAPHLSSVLKK
jgi:hypothetical protein